ncbi:MAG TPA: hypothetical protein VHZ28_09675 [Terracidiphilus sp.]|nr:hypothetical protein [Terracidiphilus sp.]
MVTLRAFEALCAGFVVTLALSFAAALLLKRCAFDLTGNNRKGSAGAITAQLGTSFLAAAAGGYATARIAEANVLADVAGLSLVLLVVAALSALQGRGKMPIAYLLASVAIAPLGAEAGGLVRLRGMGLL